MANPRLHLYDAPGLRPLGFLRAVMHDPDTPMYLRMDVAKWLLQYEPPSYPAEHTVRIPPLCPPSEAPKTESIGPTHEPSQTLQ
jgi:hypothetical protein